MEEQKEMANDTEPVILIIGISAGGWGKLRSFVGRREGWRTHMN